MLALCLYTVTGWAVVSCVYGMTFLLCNTLVKVPLLLASTVAIRPQMFKSDVKPKTNKQKYLSFKRFMAGENDVVALVQFHHANITKSANLFGVIYSSSPRAIPKRFISFVILAS